MRSPDDLAERAGRGRRMRVYKLRKCPRIHGVHFTPDGGRLLAVGGQEVRGLESAVWLDLASGDSPGRIDQYANAYAVPPDLSRYLVVGADEFTEDDENSYPVQWAPLPDFDDWLPYPGLLPKMSVIPALRDGVIGVAFDAAGRLAVGLDAEPPTSRRGAPFQVVVLRFDPPEVVRQIFVGAIPRLIASSADGSRMAVGGGVDGATRFDVHDLSTGERKFSFTPPGTVTALPDVPAGRPTGGRQRPQGLCVPAGRAGTCVRALGPRGTGERGRRDAGRPAAADGVARRGDPQLGRGRRPAGGGLRLGGRAGDGAGRSRRTG